MAEQAQQGPAPVETTRRVERRLRRVPNRPARPVGSAEGGDHRRIPRRTVAVSAGAVVLLALGGGAYALTRPGQDRYTTATAQTGTVTQTVTGAGTVASVSSATVAFQVPGAVATVDVAPGDQVDAGQTLATVDPTSLEAAVTTAEQTLEETRQQLADDQSAQTSGSSSAAATGSSGTGSSGTGPSGTGSSGASGDGSSGTGSSGSVSGPGGSSSGSTGTGTSGTSAEVVAAVAEVTAAQEALLSAYSGAAAAQSASSAALAALGASDSTAWCAQLVALDPAQVTTGSATTDPAEDGATSEPSGDSGTSLSTVQGWVASCQAALTEIGGLQTATDTAQEALSSAMTTLDTKVAALQQLVASSGTPDGTGAPSTADPGSAGSSDQTQTDSQAAAPTGSTPTGTTSASGTSTGTTPSSTVAGQSGRSSTPTAADLVADQAAIDAAEAQVALASADLQLATVTAPLSGTVAAVDLAVGDQVSASSTTSTITVIGDAGYQVSLSVDLGSIDVVEVGQPATVAAPSTDQTLDGTVTSIGVLNVSTSTTPQYTVTIRLAATDEPLYDGSSAQATITVAGASDVLTVPTSAVHVDGTTATVDVLADGAVHPTTVVRGAVGAELTEITDGLSVGDTVVLADRSQALQEESTRTTRSSGVSGQMSPGDFSGGPPSTMQRPGG